MRQVYIALAFIISSLAVYSSPASADNPASLPYYASIKADEANIRTGPSVKYPIQWTYRRTHWPVEVTASFEGWRKIADINGEIGWVHENLLSGRRYGLVTTEINQKVLRLPVPNASPVFMVENHAVLEMESCKDGWCKVSAENHEGWLQKKYLWGVEDKEEF